MKHLKIGNVKINNPLFLAPMVDVTDLAYREICRKLGAGMAYTEMIYIDAITHENERTLRLTKTNSNDSPSGIQITGNNEDELKKAIDMGAFEKFDIVDINCGCPSIRITGNSAGSYLLKNPKKIGNMIKILKDKGYNSTAKIRLGFEKNNVLKVSKIIEKSGADALTIHARLANQGMSIKPQRNWIKKVKDNIGIPVIGNGNIFSGKDAKEMLDIADGAMIARGAIGNPLIFEKINYYMRTEKEKEISYKKNLRLFRKYLELTKKYDIFEMHRVRYIGANFFKNFPGASKARGQLMTMKKREEIIDLVYNLISSS